MEFQRKTAQRKAVQRKSKAHLDSDTLSVGPLSSVQRQAITLQRTLGNHATIKRMAAPIQQRTGTRVQRWDSPEHVKLGDAGVNTGYIVIDSHRKEIPNHDKPVTEWSKNWQELYGTGSAVQKRFLKQGLSYGEIIALSGDFYSSYEELSKASITEIFELLPLIRDGATTDQLQKATGGRYLDLAEKNETHFSNAAPGKSNRETWHRMHIDALMAAINGDANAAWAMNATADHYLTDAFSGGHIRPPRSELMATTKGNVKSKGWHDLDNANGVQVTNTRGDVWTAYGDEHMEGEHKEDKRNARNLDLLREAVALSKADIQEALSQGKKYPVPSEKTRFKAQDLIPEAVNPDADSWSHWVGSKDVTLFSHNGLGINAGGMQIPLIPPAQVSVPVPTVGDGVQEFGHLVANEGPGIAKGLHEDDNAIREWVTKNPPDAISRVTATEKERLLGVLLSGWVDDTDLDAVEKIIKSIRSKDEMKYLRGRIDPLDLMSMKQRVRLRLILAHEP